VLVIQIAAAALLLLGSGLIVRALLEIDASYRPTSGVRPPHRLAEPEHEVHLRRAA